jgi:hypothetical protein
MTIFLIIFRVFVKEKFADKKNRAEKSHCPVLIPFEVS